MDNMIIGLDVGGTYLRIGAVDQERRVRCSKIIESETVSKSKDPSDTLCRIIEEFIEANQISKADAVSVGVPSSVSTDNQTVICTTNMQDLEGRPIFRNANIAAYLKERLQLPVFVNNDTGNILLYDIYSNGLQDDSVVVGIYIGTGVGASVMIDGKLMKGANGAALDLGHIPYYKAFDRCSCGKTGCCECYASGWRLKQIREKYYPEDEIRDLFKKHADEEPLQDFLYSCSHVFSVMATIFNPVSVVAGGGVLEMEGFPRKQFEKLVDQNTGLDVMTYGFRYVYSRPCTDKGIIGAALFAEKRMGRV